MEFRTAYTKNPRVQKQVTQKGRTVQAFKDQCDINRIMQKALATGMVPSNGKQPVYGDFASMPDFQQAQDIYIRSKQQFASLDAKVRAKFNNQPAAFLEWASNPANAKEMAALGLMKPDAVQRVANEENTPPTAAPESKKQDEAKK